MRIVVRENVSRDDVDDAAAENGWTLVNVVHATGAVPPQLVFLTRNRATVVHFVADGRLGAAYFAIAGADEAGAAAGVRGCVATYDRGELLAMAASDDAERAARGVRYLAIAAAEARDDDAHARFEAARTHADLRVRAAADAAAPYVQWWKGGAP